MPKLHRANVLSGLGWAGPFTRNAMLPKSPQSQRREGRVGCCTHKITGSRNFFLFIFLISVNDLSWRAQREYRGGYIGV